MLPCSLPDAAVFTAGSAVVRLWASGAGEAMSVTLPATDAPPVAIAGVRGEARGRES